MTTGIAFSIATAALVAVLASSVTGTALAQSPPQTPADTNDRAALRVCADPSGLPFSNEKEEGFENRIAGLLAAKLSLKLQYTWYPNAIGFLRNTLRVHRCDLVLGIVSGADLVLSTNPYYRSSYVIVTRRVDGHEIDTIGDPRLAALRVGITAGTPPADLAARAGLMARARPYPLHVDTRAEQPGRHMIEDLAAGQIDAALLWGPIAGYFARGQGEALKIVPLVKEPKTTRTAFWISMAVRPGETEWKNTVNQALRDHQGAITAILKEYGVPLLDARDQPLP
jgi:quinoprotein dehydrogenase-associated probable ABC transporter substrate-binding protein